MVERAPLKLNSLDTNHIVLDIGLVYTKCGFIKESVPKHIVPTPLSMIENLRNTIKEVSESTLMSAVKHKHVCCNHEQQVADLSRNRRIPEHVILSFSASKSERKGSCDP